MGVIIYGWGCAKNFPKPILADWVPSKIEFFAPLAKSLHDLLIRIMNRPKNLI